MMKKVRGATIALVAIVFSTSMSFAQFESANVPPEEIQPPIPKPLAPATPIQQATPTNTSTETVKESPSYANWAYGIAYKTLRDITESGAIYGADFNGQFEFNLKWRMLKYISANFVYGLGDANDFSIYGPGLILILPKEMFLNDEVEDVRTLNKPPKFSARLHGEFLKVNEFATPTYAGDKYWSSRIGATLSRKIKKDRYLIFDTSVHVLKDNTHLVLGIGAEFDI
jgi:hypothetical protein